MDSIPRKNYLMGSEKYIESSNILLKEISRPFLVRHMSSLYDILSIGIPRVIVVVYESSFSEKEHVFCQGSRFLQEIFEEYPESSMDIEKVFEIMECMIFRLTKSLKKIWMKLF